MIERKKSEEEKDKDKAKCLQSRKVKCSFVAKENHKNRDIVNDFETSRAIAINCTVSNRHCLRAPKKRETYLISEI